MTKADSLSSVADMIGPRITKRDCGLVVDAFLDAVRDTLVRGRPHREPRLRHLQDRLATGEALPRMITNLGAPPRR